MCLTILYIPYPPRWRSGESLRMHQQRWYVRHMPGIYEAYAWHIGQKVGGNTGNRSGHMPKKGRNNGAPGEERPKMAYAWHEICLRNARMGPNPNGICLALKSSFFMPPICRLGICLALKSSFFMPPICRLGICLDLAYA